MRVVKTIRQGLIYKTYYQNGDFIFSGAALSFFPLDNPRQLGTEPEMWDLLTQQLHEEAIFDLAMPKPNGEVLVLGECCAPRGQTVTRKNVDLRFGPLSKRLVVSGDRHWTSDMTSILSGGWTPSEPVPFERINIGWQNAFGGKDFAPNPWGKGYLGKSQNPDIFETSPLPNVETVGKFLTTPSAKPDPAGMGPSEILWPDRIKKAGTYGKKWQREDFPGYANDMNWSIFNSAPRDQQINTLWQGNESFSIKGMHPEEEIIHGKLPGIRPRMFVHLRETHDKLSWKEISLRSETIWLFPTVKWGIVLSRGIINIGTFLGSDIEALLLAYEFQDGKARSPEDYLQSLSKRDDEEISMYWISREDDLRPPESPLTREELEAMEEEQRDETISEEEDSLEDEPGQQAIEDCIPVRLPFPHKTASSSEESSAALLAFQDKAKKYEVDLEKSTPSETDVQDDAVSKMPTEPNDEHCMAAMMEYLKEFHSYGDELLFTVLSEEEEDSVKALALAEASLEAGRRIALKLGIDADKTKEASEAEFFAIEDEYYEQASAEYISEYFSYEGDPFHTPFSRKDEEFVIILAFAARDQSKLEQAASKYGIDLEEVKEKNAKAGPPDLAAALEASRANLVGNSEAQKRLDDAIGQLKELQPQLDAQFLESSESTETEESDDPKIDREFVQNLYRNKQSIAGLELSRIDLSGLDLSDADFTGSILVGANLQNTIFNRVNFSEAILDSADFSGSSLSEAHFSFAQLSGTRFHKAILDRANFNMATLNEVDFSASKLNEAVFEIDMCNGCNFDDSDFSSANVSKASFFNGTFRNASFRKANCQNTDFNESILTSADFQDAFLQETSFVNVNARGSQFFNATMADANMHLECDFSEAKFVKANCQNASFGESKFENADFSEAILTSADFNGSNLRNAILDRVIAREATFIEADLSRARMIGVDLLSGSLQGAKIQGADLSGAHLFDTDTLFADFGDAILNGTIIERTAMENK